LEASGFENNDDLRRAAEKLKIIPADQILYEIHSRAKRNSLDVDAWVDTFSHSPTPFSHSAPLEGFERLHGVSSESRGGGGVVGAEELVKPQKYEGFYYHLCVI
jgi:hypothetical protein